MKQYQGTKKKDFDELIEFINKASTFLEDDCNMGIVSSAYDIKIKNSR